MELHRFSWSHKRTAQMGLRQVPAPYQSYHIFIYIIHIIHIVQLNPIHVQPINSSYSSGSWKIWPCCFLKPANLGDPAGKRSGHLKPPNPPRPLGCASISRMQFLRIQRNLKTSRSRTRRWQKAHPCTNYDRFQRILITFFVFLETLETL